MLYPGNAVPKQCCANYKSIIDIQVNHECVQAIPNLSLDKPITPGLVGGLSEDAAALLGDTGA